MASRVALLPAINRNLPQVLDHNGSGLIVYASKNNIYVLDCRSLPPVILDGKVLRNCHDKKNGRIFSLSCCKGAFQGVVSSGEDSNVKIWNLETASCVAAVQTTELSKTVEWLHDTVTSVVFSNQKYGTVTKWNFSTNHLVKIKTASEATVTVMSSNPLCPELLAAGHANGMISILNVVNHTLAYKLKTHSQEILSLSWSPALPDTLLSTSLDMSSRVWKLDEDKPTKTYYYPQSRYKVDDKISPKLCAIFHPTDPDTIIVSNVRGDLGAVRFKENENPKFTRYTADGDPNFKSVTTMRLYFDEKDGKRRDLLLCSDHVKFSLWDVAAQSLITSLYFTIGQIVKFSLSMLNSNYLAVCVTDGTLRVWNVASEESVELSYIYIQARVKITSAAWHPVEENLLAFGTNEGRVGIIDTFKRRSMYTYESYHERTVYTVAWAPCCKVKDTDEKFFLYSCGGKAIHVDELNKPKQRSLDFFSILEKKEGLESAEGTLSEFCWKMDYSCIAVGCTKGFVDLYSDEFMFLARFTMQVPTVEFLKWHPAQTSESPEGSPYKTWIAVSGRYENIHIIDVNDIGGQFETTLCKPAVTLVGHKARVSTVCWSPHTDGHLASASKDGTVQVWNVITNVRIANYLCHMDMVSAVQWSVFDPDVIYSGGADGFLRIWNISQQTQNEITKGLRSCKVKANGKVIINSESKLALASANVSVESVPKQPEEVVLEVFPNKGRAIYKEDKMVDINLKTEVQPLKRVKSLFYYRLSKTYTKEGYLEAITTLADYHSSDDVDSNLEKSSQMLDNIKEEQDAFKYGLFTNQMAAVKLLEMRAEYENSVLQQDKAVCLEIMACNTESLIRDAAEKRKLTEFHISLAPSVSYDFWLHMCEKYGMQLIEGQHYIKGSLYLVTCGKVYEAISILLEKGLVLDALVLAKSRLPESDPVIQVILYRAIAYFSEFNLPEAKTLCYVALKDAASAAKVLYCSNDSKYIYTAAYVCKKFKLKEAEDYAYFCMERCLSQNDWPTFYRLLEHIESFKVYKAFVRVHELIASHLKVLKKEDGVFAKDIFSKTESQTCIWKGQLSETGQTVLAHICDVLKSDGTLPDDKETLESILKALDSMDAKRNKFEVDAEAHISVAICATKVIVTSLLKEMYEARKFFCQMFSTSYNIVFLPKVVSWLFLPFDMYYCSDTRRFIFDMKSDKALPFETQFQTIYEALHSKFENMINSNVSDFSVQGLQSNLRTNIEKATTVLSKKCMDEVVVLYFVVSYLNELQRCTKKGWKYICLENSRLVSDQYTEKSENIINSSQTSCKSDQEENSKRSEDIIKDSQTNEFGQEEVAINLTDISNGVENNGTSNQSDIEKLIEKVCAEAEEKVRKIVETATALRAENCETTVNGSSASPSPDGVSDFCFIEKEENTIISESVTDSEKISTCVNSNGTSCDEVREKGMSNNNTKEELPNTLLQSVPQETDVHQQCWKEVSLCYDLTKLLISVICKDEYAVLYYLESYLQELNKTLTRMARAPSKVCVNKSVTDALKHTSNDAKDVNQSEIKEEMKLNETDIKCQEVPINMTDVNPVDDAFLIKGVNISEDSSITKSAINSNDQDERKIIENGINDCANVVKNLQNCDTKHNSEISSDIASDVVNYTSDSELKKENSTHSEAKLYSGDEYGVSADAKEKAPALQTPNGESLCSASESNGIVYENAAGDDSKDKEDQKSEVIVLKEWILNQIRILKSQEFCYPNPFDAVASVKGICYHVFHKHPCKLVKTKFHELSHETTEWTNKFKTETASISCDICGKEDKLNSS